VKPLAPPRPAPKAASGLALLALGSLLSGCEGASGLAPPPPPTPSTATSDSGIGASKPSGVLRLVMILPGDQRPEYDVWTQVGRAAAGKSRAIFEATAPSPVDPPSRQVELVREAARKKPSCLIVVAADPEAMAPALAEVRDQGTPVVLLARPVAVEGAPLPLVTRGPYAAAAKELVAAVRKDALVVGFPPDAEALVLVDARGGKDSAKRAAALLEAAKAAEVPLARPTPLPFDGDEPLARKAIEETRAEGHRIGIVLADGARAIYGAMGLRMDLPREDRFVLAGFATRPKMMTIPRSSFCSAMADANVDGLATAAVEAAVRLARGETLSERIEVPLKVLRAPGPPRIPPES
jgi:ABC-type sugar transport system substrate-binding protein